jgi:lysozyme family protein
MNKPTLKKAGLSTTVAAVVAAIFAVEGGFTLDQNDRGNWTSGVVGQGELKGTNHGISAMAYPTLDIKNLTQEEATNIYIRDYISKPGYGDLITLSPAVGQKVVDAGVNAGTSRSSRWFQQSMNSLSRGGVDFPQINVDGKIGPGSIKSFEALRRIRGNVRACELTLKLLDAQQAIHYTSLSNFPQYVPGWIDHRIGNVPLSKCQEDK